MRFFTLAACAAGMLLGLAGVAAAQQRDGQAQAMLPMDHSKMPMNMPGMDHSRMPMNMQGMDHSNMPGMQGSGQTGQGTRMPAPAKPARPGATSR